MIGYMSIEEQVDADCTRAFRRAFVHRVGARLRGDPSSSRASSFEEAAKTLVHDQATSWGMDRCS
jgi:hypothetical protein